MASRVSEVRGLSEEVPPVLRVAGFVFTENPLQPPLVLRTMGMTHPWDVPVALVSAQPSASGLCVVRLRGLECMRRAALPEAGPSQPHTLNTVTLKHDRGMNAGKK